MTNVIHFYHMTYFTIYFLLWYNLFVHVLIGKNARVSDLVVHNVLTRQQNGP